MGRLLSFCKCKGYAGDDFHPIVMQLQAGMDNAMNTSAKMEQIDVLRVELAVLRREHRALDDAIAALHEKHSADVLTLTRLKKQKLGLKDKIARLEDRILPDIIA